MRINDVIPQIPGSRLTAEYQYSHDDVRESRQIIGARLRLPLDPPGTPSLASLSAQERRMIDPIERDIDVVTTQSKAEPVKDNLTKVNFDKVAYVGDGGDLTATSAAAGANTLIIATGGTITGPQTLQGQQTLQGGASTINVQGQRSGTVAPFTAPGSRPTFFNDDPINSAITILGSSVHIAGIDLEGAGTGFAGITDPCGCTPTSVRNTFIENVNIKDFAYAGVAFEDGNEVTILNTVVDTVDGYGIAFGNDNHVTLSGVTVENVAFGDGIVFFDRNTVSISNTSVSTVLSGAGIVFGYENAFSISNSQISHVCCAGIALGSDNRGQITNTSITDAADYGIVGDSRNNITIAGVAISYTGLEGILFNSRNTLAISNTSVSEVQFADGISFGYRNDVTIANTSIARVDGNGIIFGSGNTVGVTNVSITLAGDNGIQFDYRNVVTITGTTIDLNNAGSDGINFLSRNTVTIANTSISNTGDDGISFDNRNTVTITGTKIDNVFDNGILFGHDNVMVTLANTTFSGTVGGAVVDITGANSTLSGGGNVSTAAASFFCVAPFPQIDSFTFISPPATCPP